MNEPENLYTAKAKAWLHQMAGHYDAEDAVGEEQASVDAANQRYGLMRQRETLLIQYRAAERCGNQQLLNQIYNQLGGLLAEMDEIDQTYPKAKMLVEKLIKPRAETIVIGNVEREVQEAETKLKALKAPSTATRHEDG